MKLDQETVVKHQFWFLLGGYFLLWFIAVLVLKFTAPDKIEDLKKGYDGAANGVKSAQSSGPINTTTFLPPWQQEAKSFSDHKSVIWGTAWDYQKGMYDWPEEWRTKYNMTTAQAPLTQEDRYEYKDKLYPNQIDNLRAYAPKWIDPVEFKGGFNEVFRPMTRQEWKDTPTREEIWLAQEDFWVKRELFFVVWDAMINQALMDLVPIDDKKESKLEGVEARYRYRNKNWEITLNLRKNDKGQLVVGGDSTIKNIQPSRQAQPLTSAKGKGIWFLIGQDNVRIPLEVRGEPVVWNETKKFSAENYEPLSGINWSQDRLKEHPIFVSQGFDQSNCPIRRINAIELAKQDCRTFVWSLQPNNALAQLDALPEDQDPNKAAAGAPAAGAPAGGPPSGGSPAGPPGAGASGGMPGSGSMMMMNAMGMGGGATAKSGNKTPNNDIERNRYLQPSSEDKKLNLPSRHLPMAVQLIVEQAHMHNVLVALANSRLRFQITQVDFRHEKNYTPQSDSEKKDGSDKAGPSGGIFAGGMPGMYGRMPAMPGSMQQNDPSQQMRRRMQMMQQMQSQSGGMMRPPPATSSMGSGAMGSSYARAPGMPRGNFPTMPGGSDPKQSESSYDDNLVELTVYGIATLYRSPDAAPTAEQPGQPGAPPAQAGQQPAAAPPPQAAAPAATPASNTPAPQPGQQPTTTTPPPSSNPSPPAPKQPDPSGKAPPPPAGDKR